MTETAVISGDSGRAIVIVHSRSFKPAAGEYLELAVQALAAGIDSDYPESLDSFAACTKYMAYYADLTYELLISHGGTYDEKLDISDLRNALHELKGLDRRKGFSMNRYDRLPGKSAVSEFAVSLLSPVLSAVGLEKPLVAGVTKDLGNYWEKGSDYSAAVLDRVRTTICGALDTNENVMLISHGTGAIVAYDALWQLSHDPDYCKPYDDAKIDVWLTLGGPLADMTVQRQLLGADRKGRERYPTNILAWHNVSAEDDYVSHDNRVANDYRAMLRQRQISAIRDYQVYNMTIRYGTSNPHNMLGYLIHPRVAKILNDWLTMTFGQPLPTSIL